MKTYVLSDLDNSHDVISILTKTRKSLPYFLNSRIPAELSAEDKQLAVLVKIHDQDTNLLAD